MRALLSIAVGLLVVLILSSPVAFSEDDPVEEPLHVCELQGNFNENSYTSFIIVNSWEDVGSSVDDRGPAVLTSKAAAIILRGRHVVILYSH